MIHNVCCPAYFWELCCIALSLLIASNLWLFLRVLRPIRQLSAQADQLRQGNFSAIDTDCGGIPEIRTLQRSMASMAKHVRRAQRQQIRYADNLTAGQEAERQRIAHELHDDTIQSLVAISQSVEMATTWVGQMPDQAREMLQLARQQAVDTVSDLRRLIENLRPPALDELGLVTAIEMQAEQSPVPVAVNVTGVPRRLREDRELALFRIVQETMTNAARHSNASQMTIALYYTSDELSLCITDNGNGFHVPDELTRFAECGHYGLIGIQERVHQIAGTLSIESRPEQGTTLTVHIPTAQLAQPQDTVRDPVCSAVIPPQQAYASATYNDKRYFFCCPICQGAFQKEPERYVPSDKHTDMANEPAV